MDTSSNVFTILYSSKTRQNLRRPNPITANHRCGKITNYSKLFQTDKRSNVPIGVQSGSSFHFLFRFSGRELELGGFLFWKRSFWGRECPLPCTSFSIHQVMVVQQYTHRLTEDTEEAPEHHIAHLDVKTYKRNSWLLLWITNSWMNKRKTNIE